jgi:class 3 adenylate cyclase
MGAEDYLFKPVNPVLLRARVGASLEKKRLRDRQRELFRKFATAEVAEELLTTGLALGGKHVEASVMFSDIRDFTRLAETLSPADTIELLNSYYTLMFDAIGGQGGIVNQMLGDGLMAIFGAPLPRVDHRERAVRAALEMLELVDGFNREQASRGGAEIRIGIGIASGPLVAGFTGTERRVTYTCVGDTVNLAAHLEAHTKILGQPILIDENTRGGSARASAWSAGPAQLKTRSRASPSTPCHPASGSEAERGPVAAPPTTAVSVLDASEPWRISPIWNAGARAPELSTAAARDAGATTAKPIPMLKTRNISASSMRPPSWSQRNTSELATSPGGSPRGTLRQDPRQAAGSPRP